ncbi:bifunctional folylpolyglutamate synthase/dihydrofolate synthase [Candidatus Thiosymbion oneisti]|uniref:bifunctional folylpolyglutamate synthase/dihydrofolate synthase n=1 Tax=Candidatus Thiosymbion oneisti TaxID=589554 RepID=UPI000A618A6C|nr:folylpolyglutamate synthase/dihydrofolate synthase family protein [Candidatus Thiosymbion oneisti]
MRFDDLQSWLRWQETLHPRTIKLGLERSAAVWSRLQRDSVAFPVITIAGTNGKGSCAAMLESIYRAAGYRTACYTSPHLLRYNERIRLNGLEIRDATLCAAFERVDRARGASTLTYFEFGTLAALDLFVRAQPDVAILEVGLGGRLDAVNILDPDVAVVATIGMDHAAWLGDTPDRIAAEKAGIFRPHRPAVVGHRAPSGALLERSETLGCDLFVLGRDFDWEDEGSTWHWLGPELVQTGLPAPALRGIFQRDNAATVLMTVACLNPRLPVAIPHLSLGLQRTHLPGRFQIVPGAVTWLLDVAHNAQAAAALAANLRAFDCPGRMHAVLGVLQDKDPQAIAEPLAGQVDAWYLGQSADPRALPTAELRAGLEGLAAERDLHGCEGITEALRTAADRARAGDCILAFGSFTTVEAALRYIHGAAAS